MNKVINDQLQKVQIADLSNFNPETNTFVIPMHKELKIEEDCCYLIHIKPSVKVNTAVIVNWNNGNIPSFEHMKVDVSKKMGKMIKITGIRYDIETQQDCGQFWSGWLSLDDIEVLQKI